MTAGRVLAAYSSTHIKTVVQGVCKLGQFQRRKEDFSETLFQGRRPHTDFNLQSLGNF